MLLCKGTNRNGEPCKKPAVTGALVCNVHMRKSGSTQVRKGQITRTMVATEELAIELLKEQLKPAMLVLVQVMNDPNAKDSDRVAAAKNIIDRFVPAKAEVTHGEKREERDLDRELLELTAEAPPLLPDPLGDEEAV
jgi:hypothetical protein